jgi:hypothetical protein
LNDYIPSAQRATLLSLDAMLGDAGGVVGAGGVGVARRGALDR